MDTLRSSSRHGQNTRPQKQLQGGGFSTGNFLHEKFRTGFISHRGLKTPREISQPSRIVLFTTGHSPFQVLDASAIEGIRGLAGESSSIYNCIQIYKALTPPPAKALTPPAKALTPPPPALFTTGQFLRCTAEFQRVRALFANFQGLAGLHS